MGRFLVVAATVAVTLGAAPLWWMGRAVVRCHRQRRAAGNLTRTALSLYAALTTLLAVVSFVTLAWAYGLGILIAMVLAPFALGTALSAEVLWDPHPHAAGWVAAVTLGVASVGVERLAHAPDLARAAPWLHTLTAAQVALLLGAVRQGTRTM